MTKPRPRRSNRWPFTTARRSRPRWPRPSTGSSSAEHTARRSGPRRPPDLLDLAGQRSGSYLTEPHFIPKAASRAWRWAPEMEEAAEADLPDDLMRATVAVLSHWEGARDADLSIGEALDRLRD
ncbi:DUF1932 domain-containing protein [Streptomyces sp. NPDC006208]|uniref:DUF1932 domain-containing protein n=1 Tax=Streptomyces sp. NPDC006208 TaxID=3156734 RepID=UPI0033BB561C